MLKSQVSEKVKIRIMMALAKEALDHEEKNQKKASKANETRTRMDRLREEEEERQINELYGIDGLMMLDESGL